MSDAEKPDPFVQDADECTRSAFQKTADRIAPAAPLDLDLDHLEWLANSEPEDGMGGDFVIPIAEARALIAALRSSQQQVERLNEQVEELLDRDGLTMARMNTRIKELEQQVERLVGLLRNTESAMWDAHYGHGISAPYAQAIARENKIAVTALSGPTP